MNAAGGGGRRSFWNDASRSLPETMSKASRREALNTRCGWPTFQRGSSAMEAGCAWTVEPAVCDDAW